MASEARVSIGQVKRDISELVNRVAYGDERVVLTSRGKPKAAIVSIEDYEKLTLAERERRIEAWSKWKEEANALGEEILARRGGKPIDLDAILESERQEREERDDRILGRH